VTESYSLKKEYVDQLISNLALDVARNTKIGDPQLDRGISGGQAKRTTIGVALITSPGILYMDEPMSGLDSYTSNEVISIVRRLADNGMAVCLSVHSPTPFVYCQCSNLMLLTKGRVAYFGDRSKAIEHLENTFKIEDILSKTDAEWITDVIVKGDAAGREYELATNYDNSQIKKVLFSP